jgi:glycosyltransferase involved in cell wall biosynthesis
MKVLLISKIYPSVSDPDYGVFIANIEASLVERGSNVCRSVIPGRINSTLGKLYKYFVFFLSIYKNLITKDIDLIYVHFANHSLVPLLPLYRFIRKPIVINAHGGDIAPATRKNSLLISKMTGNIIKHADLIIVPTGYYRDITAAIYPGKRIFVSPSGGVDLSLFKPKERHSDDSRILRIGYVSRIDTGKGWDVLLRALAWLKHHRPELRFHVGFAGYGADHSRFHAMIQSLGLGQQVAYHGQVKQSQLPGIYNSFDLFAFPTIRPEEALGLVGIEAMACGLPVLGSRVGGLPEYIKDGHNGYLFTPGEYQELAEKIIQFSSLDSEKRKNMRENALFTAAQYGKGRVIDELYDELVRVQASRSG